MVPSIIDVWGYDREFCSSSSSNYCCSVFGRFLTLGMSCDLPSVRVASLDCLTNLASSVSQSPHLRSQST